MINPLILSGKEPMILLNLGILKLRRGQVSTLFLDKIRKQRMKKGKIFLVGKKDADLFPLTEATFEKEDRADAQNSDHHE